MRQVTFEMPRQRSARWALVLAGGLVGALTAMLVKTSPTETLKAASIDNPMPVKPITSIADPVHTEETKTIEEWNTQK